MMRHNFCAGPALLPQEVTQQAAQAVLDYNASGLSLLGMSHRSAAFIDILDEARTLALELSGLQNKGYQALFLHGGASMQFAMVPMNLLAKKASFLDTGVWALKAIKAASFFGPTDVAASSASDHYRSIPKTLSVADQADYLHCTSNNTIYGTQMHEFPQVSAPLVCDMSSDIFSRQIDFSAFDLIYAGAQKNIGAAGVALVLVKESALGKTGRELPDFFDFRKHISAQNLLNTPPVFAIYTCLLTLRWIKNRGLENIERNNREKAALLYAEIDRNPLFEGNAMVQDRSLMNAVFKLSEPALEPKFDALCEQAGIYGIKGHRTTGGYRASMYNALSAESVQTLVDCMRTLN